MTIIDWWLHFLPKAARPCVTHGGDDGSLRHIFFLLFRKFFVPLLLSVRDWIEQSSRMVTKWPKNYLVHQHKFCDQRQLTIQSNQSIEIPAFQWVKSKITNRTYMCTRMLVHTAHDEHLGKMETTKNNTNNFVPCRVYPPSTLSLSSPPRPPPPPSAWWMSKAIHGVFSGNLSISLSPSWYVFIRLVFLRYIIDSIW